MSRDQRQALDAKLRSFRPLFDPERSIEELASTTTCAHSAAMRIPPGNQRAGPAAPATFLA